MTEPKGEKVVGKIRRFSLKGHTFQTGEESKSRGKGCSAETLHFYFTLAYHLLYSKTLLNFWIMNFLSELEGFSCNWAHQGPKHSICFWGKLHFILCVREVQAAHISTKDKFRGSAEYHTIAQWQLKRKKVGLHNVSTKVRCWHCQLLWHCS